MATYEGGCFCGAVKVKATGEPLEMGYCHCKNCSRWSGGGVNPFVLWKQSAVEVSGGDLIKFDKNGGSQNLADWDQGPVPSHDAVACGRLGGAGAGFSERWACAKCGGSVLDNHRFLPKATLESFGGPIYDVFAPILPTFPFKANLHINYASRMFNMEDGLPKFADFPPPFRGTGKMLDEKTGEPK